MSLNKVALIGNLGADPETKVFQDGNSLTNINLYTDDSYKDAQGNKVEAHQIHRVVFRGSIANIATQYLKKGSKVYVEGKLNHRSFVNKEGITQYVTEVMVAGFQGVLKMLDQAPKQAQPQAQAQAQPQPQTNEKLADIPF